MPKCQSPRIPESGEQGPQTKHTGFFVFFARLEKRCKFRRRREERQPFLVSEKEARKAQAFLFLSSQQEFVGGRKGGEEAYIPGRRPPWGRPRGCPPSQPWGRHLAPHGSPSPSRCPAAGVVVVVVPPCSSRFICKQQEEQGGGRRRAGEGELARWWMWVVFSPRAQTDGDGMRWWGWDGCGRASERARKKKVSGDRQGSGSPQRQQHTHGNGLGCDGIRQGQEKKKEMWSKRKETKRIKRKGGKHVEHSLLLSALLE